MIINYWTFLFKGLLQGVCVCLCDINVNNFYADFIQRISRYRRDWRLTLSRHLTCIYADHIRKVYF